MHPPTTPGNPQNGAGRASAEQLALQALRNCRNGELREAVALYRRALAAPGGAALPVTRHVRLLEGTGLKDAATSIWRAGLQAGADMSSGAFARGGDAGAAVAEYEELFARGIANARMMADYLVALSRTGAAEKLAAATDPALLFRRRALPMDGPLQPFLERVAAALLGATGRRFQTATKSIRKMERVPGAHELRDADVVALHSAVRILVSQYVEDVARSGHPIARWLRREFGLCSWGVISEDEVGYNAPHIHTGCWIVAVAYVAGPARGGRGDDAGGTLRIGAAEAGDATCKGWPDLTVAPDPGVVVVMPAFYTHWTLPLKRRGLRISVAFNASDELADEVTGAASLHGGV
jgi:hypothetical protein